MRIFFFQREWKGGKWEGRGKGKNVHASTWTGCLLNQPQSKLQPRYMPWPGIKPEIHLATRARDNLPHLLIKRFKLN